MLMNGTDTEQTLQLDRFHEVIKGKTAGKDVISGQTIQLGDALSIPARGIYILDL